jgi:colicin import membrane protein
MPLRLKTYVTTSGFFELAVAAPSMKAALEIWGAGRDLFQRGYAQETSDPAIVKAALAKPGVVLQRGVGASGVFTEHAELPDVSTWDRPAKSVKAPRAPAPRKTEAAEPKAEPAAQRTAAQLYEAAQKKREREAARIEASQRKARERQEREIEKAEAALIAAREAHQERVSAIEDERAKLDRRAQDEDERWRTEKRQRETVVEKARSQRA